MPRNVAICAEERSLLSTSYVARCRRRLVLSSTLQGYGEGRTNPCADAAGCPSQPFRDDPDGRRVYSATRGLGRPPAGPVGMPPATNEILLHGRPDVVPVQVVQTCGTTW